MTLQGALNDLIERTGRIVVLNEADAQEIDRARRAVAQAVPAADFLIRRMSNPPRSGLYVP